MQKKELTELLYDSPIIAAVKHVGDLDAALASDCQVLFLMCGTICTIGELSQRAKAAGKAIFVHLDLIEGLSNQNTASVDFLRQQTAVDGIISTKAHLIAHAKSLGLLTIQRYFLLDSLSLDNLLRQPAGADAVEILPAVVPKVIQRILQQKKLFLIAGGLISDKEDIVSVLNAGAIAVSSTNRQLWSV